MFNQYHLNRFSLIWLFIAQVFLLLPHWLRFPELLLLPSVVCGVWAVQVFRGRWSPAPMLIKAVFMLVTIGLLISQEFKWRSTEFMVCLLLLAYILKLLELKSHRDVLIMTYLSYFVIVGQLLFSQSILSALYLLVGLLLCTSFLIAAFSGQQHKDFFQPLKMASKMGALSLPLMILAFLVFPRLEPFWSVPLSGAKAKTGVSDNMTPGMFSKLAQSDELAFRVRFDKKIPVMHDLYWRGLVLNYFDGRRWTALVERPFNSSKLEDHQRKEGAESYDSRFDYKIIMEPTYKPWLFILSSAIQVQALNQQKVQFLRDATLQTYKPIMQRTEFSISSDINLLRDPQIYSYHRQAALQLPPKFNPQSQAFAEKLFAKSSSDQAYIDAVLNYFSQQPFYYSLSPGALGVNYVDDFLFKSRIGFCEHFASSFVVLMRAVGIPARVVTGYQGGDVNPYENHISVRQMDAHAWAEVWLQGQGWIRIDPTAAVAPERIERGSVQSLKNDENFLAGSPLSAKHFNSLSWMLNLSYRYDQLSALWHSQILAYQGDVQQNTLKRLLGEVNSQTMLLFSAGFFALFALLTTLYFSLSWKKKSVSKAEQQYQRFINKAAKAGLKKAVAEGPLDFQRRCIVQWPQQKRDIDIIIMSYIELVYAAEDLNSTQYSSAVKDFANLIKCLSLKPS